MESGCAFPSVLLVLASFLVPVTIAVPEAAAESITVVEPQQPGSPERLAAREVRRYLYLRTGQVLPIVASEWQRPLGRSIVVAHKDQPVFGAVLRGARQLAESVRSVGPQEYLLKTVPLASRDRKPVLLVVGGDSVGTLYGAYRLAEHLGVRFYLHGDVVPDSQRALTLPMLDERGAPLFQTRGIQPFHDFPEGPDRAPDGGAASC